MRLAEVHYECLVDPLRDKLVGLVQNPFGNVGDRLIELGVHKLFCHFDIRYRVVARTEIETGKLTEQVDVLVCPGGGNVGRRFTGSPSLRRNAAKLKIPMVLFPQTAADDGEDLSCFERVYVREKTSYEMLARLHPHVEMAPDTALVLDVKPDAAEREHYLALRCDWEATDGLRGTPRTDPARRVTTAQDYLRLAACYRRITTNRLHFAIAGLLQDRQVHLLSGAYHKNRSMYDTWLHQFPGCKFEKTIGFNAREETL